MKSSFSIPKSNMITKKMKKKNKSKMSYPTYLHRKMKESQLKLKNHLKKKFFLLYHKQWNSNTLSQNFFTQFSLQPAQCNPRSIKNTKNCILTGKFTISSRSNINSRMLKSLVESGEITNLKKSMW